MPTLPSASASTARRCTCTLTFPTVLHKSALRQYRLLATIWKAGEWRWQANAWQLERMRPEQFGRREPDAFYPDQLRLIIAYLARMTRRFVPAETRAEFEGE